MNFLSLKYCIDLVSEFLNVDPANLIVKPHIETFRQSIGSNTYTLDNENVFYIGYFQKVEGNIQTFLRKNGTDLYYEPNETSPPYMFNRVYCQTGSICYYFTGFKIVAKI